MGSTGDWERGWVLRGGLGDGGGYVYFMIFVVLQMAVYSVICLFIN